MPFILIIKAYQAALQALTNKILNKYKNMIKFQLLVQDDEKMVKRHFYLPSSWQELTIGQMNKLCLCAEGNTSAMLAALTGEDAEIFNSAPVITIGHIVAHLGWLKTPVPYSK